MTAVACIVTHTVKRIESARRGSVACFPLLFIAIILLECGVKSLQKLPQNNHGWRTTSGEHEGDSSVAVSHILRIMEQTQPNF